MLLECKATTNLPSQEVYAHKTSGLAAKELDELRENRKGLQKAIKEERILLEKLQRQRAELEADIRKLKLQREQEERKYK